MCVLSEHKITNSNFEHAHPLCMQIAVIGASEASPELLEAAGTVGYLLASHNATLICGGMGGVMEAACKGAKEHEGTCVGILPGFETENPYLDIVIKTGFGKGRNVLIVNSADSVIAVGGGYGTLSEISLALKMGKPVFGFQTWDIDGVISCPTPNETVLVAVKAALLAKES